MVTGDNLDTAKAIAVEAGILKPEDAQCLPPTAGMSSIWTLSALSDITTPGAARAVENKAKAQNTKTVFCTRWAVRKKLCMQMARGTTSATSSKTATTSAAPPAC